MTNSVLDLTEWEEAKKALELLPQETMVELRGTMAIAANYVAGLMKEYAPESEANRPGRWTPEGDPMPWYERGRGSWRPIKHIPAKLGVRLGYVQERLPRATVTYKLRPTSQQLGRNWTSEVQETSNEILGLIGNKVTYMPYVQVAAVQWILHGVRGWKTEEDNLETAEPELRRLFDEAIQNVLSKFLNS